MPPNPSLSILQVITQRRFSGAERICLILCRELQRRGHRVRLICKPGTRLPEEAINSGIEVLTPGISGKLNLLAPFRIAALAREIDADVIHTHLSTATLMGCLAGRLTGIPVVGHVHALNNWQNFRMCDRVVTCSRGVAGHIMAQGAPEARITVALNGIEPERFRAVPSRAECRALSGFAPDARLVGCVAHLSPKKGQEHLIRAFAALSGKWPDLHALLIGEGEMRERLSELARSLGVADRIHLLGYREDAMSLMNAVDIAVLPSVAKEGLGLVLVEASLLGKPVLGSDAPGIDEAVEDGKNGFLFPPGDDAMLASLLDRLLGNAELAESMGRYGRERALRMFTVQSMTDRIEELYREIAEARAK